jgi:hypothetical protein
MGSRGCNDEHVMVGKEGRQKSSNSESVASHLTTSQDKQSCTTSLQEKREKRRTFLTGFCLFRLFFVLLLFILYQESLHPEPQAQSDRLPPLSLCCRFPTTPHRFLFFLLEWSAWKC